MHLNCDSRLYCSGDIHHIAQEIWAASGQQLHCAALPVGCHNVLHLPLVTALPHGALCCEARPHTVFGTVF